MTRVFVITGPSGVGKGTLIAALRERHPELELSVSATTRQPRPGERDGIAYHFLSEEEFDRRLQRGEFIEHAGYAGHRYGTLRGELERRTRGGTPVVLEIELQGARQLRDALLLARGAEQAEAVARRLAIAETELAARDEFGFVVVNDELDRAVGELEAIYLSYTE